MPGLATNTTYYVRAYATNGVGTGYGNQVTFATIDGTISVVTNSATADICTNACNAQITVVSTASNTCNIPIIGRGVQLADNPSFSNASLVSNGNGVGAYTTSLDNLTCNTQYYARAYVIRTVSPNVVVYGNVIPIKTITTEPSMSVSITQTKYCEATVSITNINNGCRDTATYSVTLYDQTVGNGGTITGLFANTNYQWNGEITNSLKTVYYYGIITTMSRVVAEVVVTHSEITSNSVKLTLSITNTPNPSVVSTSITLNGVGTVTSTGSFFHTFIGLTPSTNYNYNGNAISSCNDQGFSGNLGFKTSEAPTCTPATVVAVSASSGGNPLKGIMFGKVTSQGTFPVTSVYFKWGTTSNNYPNTRSATYPGVNGIFDSGFFDISPNVLYYFRVYAVTECDISESLESSFQYIP